MTRHGAAAAVKHKRARCCCCSTQRAWSPDPQARGSLSLWTSSLHQITTDLNGPCSCPLFVCSRRGAHIFTHTHACMSAAVLCGSVSNLHTVTLRDSAQTAETQQTSQAQLSTQGGGHSSVTVGKSGLQDLVQPGSSCVSLVGSTPALTLFLHAHVHSFLGDTRSRAE